MQSQDPIYFAPQRKFGGGWICFKDSPSPPPAPDYTGAAQATAAGNLQAAQAATKANRVNQYSPYGSSTYTQADPNDPNSQWSQQISLSDTGQKLLDRLVLSGLPVPSQPLHAHFDPALGIVLADLLDSDDGVYHLPPSLLEAKLRC